MNLKTKKKRYTVLDTLLLINIITQKLKKMLAFYNFF